MVKIYYDSGTGLIELRVSAFSPEDARTIANSIFESSSNMINEISAIAREDSTQYAKLELDKALENLKIARSNVTQFRARTQIVDPTVDVQGQMGLLVNLQAELADTLIELDLLTEVTESSDPRILQATRKVNVIQRRIEGERSKIGLSTGQGDDTFSLLVGQYEALVVDREFAEQSYLAARALYDQALAESGRKSRYLAAYVSPTLAETAEYPKRMLLSITVMLFLLMTWSILVLIAYSIKDRR
jgi:capsular polysaccharide transport system permease protein